MSHRATRVKDATRIEPFDYAQPENPPGPLLTSPARARTVHVVPPGSAALSRGPMGSMLVSQSAEARGPQTSGGEAFAQGYAEGERAGVEVASRQLKTLRDRLSQTLDELTMLREELTHRTERQVVELALAVAARILHREVSLDRELLLVMARIALDRLSDVTTATIRLNPDDEAAVRGGRESWPGGTVTILADPAVRPGGCLVQTDLGQIELSVDAQLKELATALLGDVPVAQAVGPRDE